MIEEEKDPSAEYIKAFNNGYIMQQHEPELLNKVFTGNEKSEQIKAMKAGQQQFERDQILKQIKLAKSKNNEKDKTR